MLSVFTSGRNLTLKKVLLLPMPLKSMIWSLFCLQIFSMCLLKLVWVTIAHVTCDLPTKLRSRGSGRSKKDQDMKPQEPTMFHLTADVALGLVPDALYNFMAWTVGATNVLPPDNSRVQVKDAKKSKIVSICQDVMNLASSGRTIMLWLCRHSSLGC